MAARRLEQGGQVVAAQHQVLGGRENGLTAGRVEQVRPGRHPLAGLGDGLDGEGKVDGHLVAVEVGVVWWRASVKIRDKTVQLRSIRTQKDSDGKLRFCEYGKTAEDEWKNVLEYGMILTLWLIMDILCKLG